MKLKLLFVVVVAGVQGACAGVEGTRAPVLVASAPQAGSPTVSGGSCPFLERGPYSGEQVDRILRLRDNGESLSNVAREVGGTRFDVKRVELAERARMRRGHLTCDSASTPEVVTQLAGDTR